MTMPTKPNLFPLGQILSTPGTLKALEEAEIQPLELLNRHVVGDWGDLVDEDKDLNDQAVGEGTRILSAYVLDTGAKVWIITEGDRRATTLLLPEEY
jgi:hypothetical protein